MSTPSNPSAFPCTGSAYCQQEGMTLRDYFASQIIGHIVAAPVTDKALRDGMKETAASSAGEAYACIAYRIADAMLAERAKAV